MVRGTYTLGPSWIDLYRNMYQIFDHTFISLLQTEHDHIPSCCFQTKSTNYTMAYVTVYTFGVCLHGL